MTQSRNAHPQVSQSAPVLMIRVQTSPGQHSSAKNESDSYDWPEGVDSHSAKGRHRWIIRGRWSPPVTQTSWFNLDVENSSVFRMSLEIPTRNSHLAIYCPPRKTGEGDMAFLFFFS